MTDTFIFFLSHLLDINKFMVSRASSFDGVTDKLLSPPIQLHVASGMAKPGGGWGGFSPPTLEEDDIFLFLF